MGAPEQAWHERRVIGLLLRARYRPHPRGQRTSRQNSSFGRSGPQIAGCSQCGDDVDQRRHTGQPRRGYLDSAGKGPGPARRHRTGRRRRQGWLASQQTLAPAPDPGWQSSWRGSTAPPGPRDRTVTYTVAGPLHPCRSRPPAPASSSGRKQQSGRRERPPVVLRSHPNDSPEVVAQQRGPRAAETLTGRPLALWTHTARVCVTGGTAG